MNVNRELNEPTALLIKAEGTGTGSGFFVRKDLIVTNIHVVAAATSVSAKLVDSETQFTVSGVTASDSQNDLVILKIIGEGTPHPIGDSNLVESGDIVQTIGYPNGKYEVTAGHIRSIRNSDKWIRMGLKAISGNSGGPVLNITNEVIGVAAINYDSHSVAIPVNMVKKLLKQTQRIGSLAQWQEQQPIRAYACAVQSQTKCSAAQKKHSAILYDEAIAYADKAIQLNPDHAYFYHHRGVAKSELGKLKTDESDLTAAQQQYRDAIVDYRTAIKLCPDYALAYNNRADAKYNLGKLEVAARNGGIDQNLYQAAIIDINIAIGLDPDNAIFYHTRGQINHALIDFTAALEDYERAREKDPDYTDVCKDLELAKEAIKQ